jgi:ferredoxin--NADP+ reductase
MSIPIVERTELIPGQTTKLVLHAPHVAAKAKPGNFVILRVTDKGERIPLTIADADAAAGTITLVYLVLGKTTWLLDRLQQGQELQDVCGPLGRATHIERYDKPVVCVGGGTGIAAMHHIAKGFAAAGNTVISVIGARREDLLLFRDELAAFSEIRVATDDGSAGTKGFVTDVLRDWIKQGNDPAEVVAVGPVPMMRAVAELTRPFGFPTTVSLNSIMIDGIGMCGACRVTVGGETRFACVDGPEFDGHQVDFAELQQRLCAYHSFEQRSYRDCDNDACGCGHG